MTKNNHLGIATFPQFAPLTFSLKQEIDRIVKDLVEPPASCLFTNLFIMDSHNTTQLSLDQTCLIIKQEIVESVWLFTVVGSFIDDTVAKLLQQNLTPIETWQLYPNAKADWANAEYLYQVAGLLGLQGKKYENLRRKINQYDWTDQTQFRQLVDEEFDQAWALAQKQYQATKDFELLQEREAFEKLILFKNDLDVEFWGIFEKNVLVGFTVLEIVPQKIGVIHFFKTEHHYRGLAEKLFIEVANVLAKRKIPVINFQQDLDKPGLRRFKNSLRPSAMWVPYLIHDSKPVT